MIYLVPLDHLCVNQGIPCVSNEMGINLEAVSMTLRDTPIESLGSRGEVTRYHAPLKAAYEKIRADADCEYGMVAVKECRHTPSTARWVRRVCTRYYLYTGLCLVQHEQCPHLLNYSLA